MFDIQRTIKLVQGALFDAEVTWRTYLPEAGDWKRTAVLVTIPVVVAAMLVAYVLGLFTSGAAVPGLRPTLFTTLIGIVTALIGLGLAAFIFSFLAGVFGGQHDFALGFSALSLASVPAYVGQALSSLPFIGWLITLVLGIYSLVLLWRIIPLYLKVEQGGRRALHYIVSLVVTIVVGAILSAALVGGQLARM